MSEKLTRTAKQYNENILLLSIVTFFSLLSSKQTSNK